MEGIIKRLMENRLESLMEMANLCGKHIRTDKVNFSFYFSSKEECSCGMHGIRVKLKWNREKTAGGMDGTMEIHTDYDYEHGSKENEPNSHQLKEARDFFKKYKVLFSAVWESKLDPQPVQDYLRNIIDFEELKSEFDVIEEHASLIRACADIEELERIVRDNNIFNMND